MQREFDAASGLDAMLDDVHEVVTSHLKSSEPSYRSDLDTLAIVLSLVTGFFASVAANQVPLLSAWLSKKHLSREELQLWQEALRRTKLSVRLDIEPKAIATELERHLPPSVGGRQQLSESAVDRLMARFGKTE